MSVLNLAATMDGLGAAAAAWAPSGWNIYPFPIKTITIPCVLVDFPTTVEIGVTFGRGGDHAVFPVYVLVGDTWTKAARDALSVVMAGGADIVAALSGTFSWGDVDVQSAEVATVVVNATSYLGLKFMADVT